MFAQMAIDRITETENLTGDLEDDAADWLINWGIEQAQGLITNDTDADVAGDKISTVMDVMRQINQIVSSRKSADLNTDLQKLATLQSAAFGTSATVSAPDYQTLAHKLKGQSASKALATLAAFVRPAVK